MKPTIKLAFLLLFLFIGIAKMNAQQSQIIKGRVTDGNDKSDNLIQLTPSTTEIGEVVVTGQYSPQSLKSSVYNVRVINQERIQLRAATNVEQVLNTELGVRFTNDLATGQTNITLMGVAGQDVKILLDGVPLLDRGDSRQSLTQIDVNTIERIELVEGPMSVIYGSDALAGVINIITKKGRGNGLAINARILEETVGDEYNFMTGDGIHNESLGVTWNSGNFRLLASGSRNEFGGWKNGRTNRSEYWQPKTQYLASGTVGYNNEKLDVWYRLDYLNEDIYTPGAYNGFNYIVVDKDFLTSRFTHQLQANLKFNNKFSINGAASYQDYERDTETYKKDMEKGTQEPTGQNESGWDQAPFSSAFFRTTATWKISDAITIQPGMELKWDEGSGERINNNIAVSTTDFAGYISAEIKPWSWMNVRPGIRFVYNSVYDAPPAVPSINTKFILAKNWDLRVGYGYGFRAPSLNELYFTYQNTNHNISGNPNLKAEYSNSFTGSVAWNDKFGNHWRLASTFSGFYNDFKNRITTMCVDETSSPPKYQYTNISRYKTTGGTWANSLLYKEWNASLGVSYIGYYNEFEGKTVENSMEKAPEFTWSPEINSTVTYNWTKLKGSISVFYKYTGKYSQYLYDDASQKTYLGYKEAYNWLDLTLTKEITKGLSMNAGVKNLFNIKSIDNSINSGGHGGGTGISSQSYGTSFFIGATYNFNN